MNSRSQISVNTIFYIFVGIVFASILLFGFKSISSSADTISQQELSQIKDDFNEWNEICDPLKKGSTKDFTINAYDFDTICFLSDDMNQLYSQNPEIKTEILDNGNNVIFAKSEINNNGKIESITEVKYFFKIESSFSRTSCIYGEDIIKVEAKCS